MGSRRVTPQSSFGNGNGNGRSTNGVDVNETNRSGGCSYLSNVRPETRSTLCSVIAQLTEETQPSFETTLKSKAVSENCTAVKFSCVVTGHPVPQVTWYKNGMQLDRYCGLPKYEIFRNGHNHSLHIYNCTEDDAAIYQASAINTKGIVSCSGVLEVGEMNEFMIHQHYFAKLKQKAEHKRKEAEGKENQEPLRTISPERTQRKRRSTMDAFLNTPSSTEDEGGEENHEAVAVEDEGRLQEAAPEEVKEKMPVTNGAVSTLTNGQTTSDGGSDTGTFAHDSAQKIPTTHQAKTPFVKKKIKISSSVKVAKADACKERVSAERTSNDDASPSISVQSAQPKQNPGELMEVENATHSSLENSDLNDKTEERQKPSTQEPKCPRRPLKHESTRTEGASQKEQRVTVSLPRTTLISSRHAVFETEVKKAAAHEKKTGRKETKESLETQSQHPRVKTFTQPPSSSSSRPPATVKKDVHTTDRVTAMEVDQKVAASCDRSRRHSESADPSRDHGAASPQRANRPSADRPSTRQTSPRQNKASASRPAPPGEVTQAHAKMNRNGTPVRYEILPNQPTAGSKPPQRPPVERGAHTCDNHTSAPHSSLETTTEQMKQDTSDRSRNSNESHMGLSARLQKPPLQSPGVVASRGHDVSPPVLQHQVDTTTKTDKGSERHDGKVEGNKEADLLVQAESSDSKENLVEMESELHVVEQTETEVTKCAANEDSQATTVGASDKKTDEFNPIAQKNSPELESLKSEVFKKVPPLLPKLQEITNSLELINNFQEVEKPATKIISIAELLRAQIKALESSLFNSMFDIPTHSDLVQDPTATARGPSQDSGDVDTKFKSEVKEPTSEKKTEISTEEKPPTNIKTTILEVSDKLHKNQDQKEILAPVQELREPLVIPPISPTDADAAPAELQRNTKQFTKGVMDVSNETEASTPPRDASITERSPSLNLKDELYQDIQSDLNQPDPSVPVLQECSSPVALTLDIQHTNVTVLDHNEENVTQNQDEPLQKFPPEIKPEGTITEINLTSLSDQDGTEDLSTNTSSSENTKSSEETVCTAGTQGSDDRHPLIQQETVAVDEQLKPDSAGLTPEPSPVLKRRNCVSPIPSATPQELASGARRKILTLKAKPEELPEETPTGDNQAQKKEAPPQSSKLPATPVTPCVSPSPPRRSPLLQPATTGQTSPVERRSPQVSRRKTVAEAPTLSPSTPEETQQEKKPAEKDKHNPFKAPQVIRKIRAEHFSDASGHLKLWCQFFNVLSDSTIKWYKNEEEITQIKRSAGDEAQVNLAIVQASAKDSGVYGCSITNKYGTDSTDILLSADILAGMCIRDDLGAGEEIEMMPLIFSKGVADSGVWGNKLFGRVMVKESYIGDGCSHKVWRAKVIYGLEPVFESGNTCIIKVRNPIAYGGKEESLLQEKNLDNVKQACKIQNLAREYCKIFSAEARVLENFGPCLEVIPVYMMYRPANTIPHATVETDLTGEYQKYSVLDAAGRIDVRSGSEVEQKCSALQHWIHQWTSGNLLFSHLEGVDTKITNVGISVKSTGHQGLSVEGNPQVFEQFVSQHKCNYFCGLLSLRSLKVMDSLMTPSKPKGSKSPLLQRKLAGGSSSPQTGRKAARSPRMPRKVEEDSSKTVTKEKTAADASQEVKPL